MKEYVKPQIEIVEMEMQYTLLAGSVFGVIDSDYGGKAGIGRKQHDMLWDDDEIE